VKPGDLVRIHFWDEAYSSDLFGIIILVRDASWAPSSKRKDHPRLPLSMSNVRWYKVWVNGAIAEFTKEELQLIE